MKPKVKAITPIPVEVSLIANTMLYKNILKSFLSVEA